MFYNRELTVSERQKIESYMAAKYGITLSGGATNYLNGSGSVIWNATTNSTYRNNITII